MQFSNDTALNQRETRGDMYGNMETNMGNNSNKWTVDEGLFRDLW